MTSRRLTKYKVAAVTVAGHCIVVLLKIEKIAPYSPLLDYALYLSVRLLQPSKEGEIIEAPTSIDMK